MKSTSVIAIILAMGIGIATAALAQVSVETSVGVSTEISASVDPSSTLNSVVSEVSSAVSEASSELSSAVSEASSMMSSASGEMSSEDVSSSSSMMSSQEMNCSDIDQTSLVGSPLDAAVLGAVTSVTIFVVDDCSGLSVSMDATAIAQFQTSPVVVDALASGGQSGSEIVAYSLDDGTALTLYVRSRNM